MLTSAGTANSLLLSLGSISRNPGGTVDFTLPSGTQSATNGITTTTPDVPTGILGGYATVNGGTDWASSAGSSGTPGNITAYRAYTGGDLGALMSNGTLNVKPFGSQTTVTTADSFNTLNLTGTVGVAMSGSGSLSLLSGGLIGNTSGSISGGTLAGSASGELIVILPANLTISSVIAATAITVAGTGTLTVTSPNAYTGNTVIDGGALVLANSNAAQTATVGINVNNGLQFASGIGTFNIGSLGGSGNLVLANTAGGAITVVTGENNANTTCSGVISGPGTLVHNGSGTMVLAAANTFSGGLILGADALVITNSASAGTGSISFAGSSTISVTANMTVPNAFVIESNTTGTINTADYTVALAGPITGPGSLNKIGSGTLIVAASNSYSGGTSISQGALQLANAAAIQNSTVSINTDNGLLFSPDIGTFNVGGLAGSNALALNDTSGTPIMLVAGGNNQDTTFGGAISGSGTLIKAGTGSLDLTGSSSSWTGGMILDPGSVTVSSDAALGAPSNSITFDGNSTLQADASFALSPSRNMAISSSTTATFDTKRNTLAIAGAISGSGALAVVGGGTLVLSGSNDYSGGTVVDAGTLLVTIGVALPAAARLTIGAGGTFVFDPSASAMSAASSVSPSLAAVPEPGTLLLLAAALGLWGGYCHRKKDHQEHRPERACAVPATNSIRSFARTAQACSGLCEDLSRRGNFVGHRVCPPTRKI